jgi:putative oxidoreductase
VFARIGTWLDAMQPIGLLTLRGTLGAIMVVHGWPKVFGGLQQYAGFIGGLGLPPYLGYVSAFTEVVGGAMLIAGLFTRSAATAVMINMAVAVWKVHWAAGFKGPRGYEFPLMLAIAAFALITLGAGSISLDRVLGRRGGGARRK